MRACIHGAAASIGGSCLELEQDGARIVLDLGAQFDGDCDAELPAILGNDLLAIVVSHNHLDHMGLVKRLPAGIAVYGPATAQQMTLAGASFARPDDVPPRAWSPLAADQRMSLGPFTVTALPVDHSAFESYALLVEAGGRRLLYSGDLRAHGRKPGMWHRLLNHPPAAVHAFVLEGTTLARDGRSRASATWSSNSRSYVRRRAAWCSPAMPVRTSTGS